MLRILCTGDSHTWGQGAAGDTVNLNPPAKAGDLRLNEFAPGSYVNRLRRMVEAHTNSASREWSAQELAALCEAPYAPPCALLTDQTLTLPFTGALLRVEYARGEAPCALTLTVDGETQAYEEPAGVLDRDNDFVIRTLHLEEGEHTLTVAATAGTLRLYRVESYTGDFAVINGGIGSCPCFRYLDTYFADYVAATRPDVVLAEAHTINDWIASHSPEVYEKELYNLLTACQNAGARVILMTVAPIAGNQRWQGGALYSDYVEASRRAAAAADVSVCDANRVMAAGAIGYTDKELHAWLLWDEWHPNDRGHAMYAELLYRELINQGILPCD